MSSLIRAIRGWLVQTPVVVLLLAGILHHPLAPGLPVQGPISRHQGKRMLWIHGFPGALWNYCSTFTSHVHLK
jgi:hypothetical protein